MEDCDMPKDGKRLDIMSARKNTPTPSVQETYI